MRRQYVTLQDERQKIPLMMQLVASFDYIVVETEHEALVLERNLIGRTIRTFNVDLKGMTRATPPLSPLQRATCILLSNIRASAISRERVILVPILTAARRVRPLTRCAR